MNPLKNKPKKVLVLGSGSLKIGEAGEFDYSGSQCLKALKEEGVETVLINPNIATNQTDEGLADKIYFLPITPKFVEKVILKEKPDAILLSFGGQTALNCGVKLWDDGILQKNNVIILGTPIETIKNTEDRQLFAEKVTEIGLKIPESEAVNSLEAAARVANKIGYPVMLRVAYALGGQGSGIAKNEVELQEKIGKALASSPQILIEKYLEGWKEIEYEIVRDQADNCIIVCNMENLDPMGVHTGESIVVAPSQTLNNEEYHLLRSIAIKLIRHLGIIGECNIQYALNPESGDYRIIEVNARLSRSSALASKATGYPLAFIAAKISLGYTITEIENKITKVTKASFEPALDYVVIKIPRWDLKKFKHVTSIIGSEMKSVGEVMAIGRTFEEALQKAIRMLGTKLEGVVGNNLNFENLEMEIRIPHEKRLFAIVEALRQGYSISQINQWSKIDPWYLYKIKNILNLELELTKHSLSTITPEIMRKAKQTGFSDLQIAKCVENNTLKNNWRETERKVRQRRKEMEILPVIKQIDTLGAEYPARTNYLYVTYNGTTSDIIFPSIASDGTYTGRKVIVLGSGAYRIGSSVEFDWCCVNAVNALKEKGYQTITINYNPETVSTDYDTCDFLYFEELSVERILDICDVEKPLGIIVSFGGQIPNELALLLHQQGIKILGTRAESIDQAEDRHKFSALLDSLQIQQPLWIEARSISEVELFAEKVSYPVLIRPSYVLSGAAMSIASNHQELAAYLKKATEISPEYPVVISKFITNAKEIEFDAVAQDGKILVHAISEHIENAGVHSGDATLVLPPQKTYLETIRRIEEVSAKIASALHVSGPFNVQYIAQDNHVQVIECNLRTSRSFPFVSKVLNTNFVKIAIDAIFDKNTIPLNQKSISYVGVKAPQFSFARLHGADPILGVEMASTGEVGCFGEDVHEALLKSMLSVGYKIPQKNILLSTGPLKDKVDLLDSINILQKMGFNLYATSGTHNFLQQNGIATTLLHWPSDEMEPNVITYIKEKKLDFIINIPKNYEEKELTNDYRIRRTAVDFNLSLITNAQLAHTFIEAIQLKKIEELEIKEIKEYWKQ